MTERKHRTAATGKSRPGTNGLLKEGKRNKRKKETRKQGFVFAPASQRREGRQRRPLKVTEKKPNRKKNKKKKKWLLESEKRSRRGLQCAENLANVPKKGREKGKTQR